MEALIQWVEAPIWWSRTVICTNLLVGISSDLVGTSNLLLWPQLNEGHELSIYESKLRKSGKWEKEERKVETERKKAERGWYRRRVSTRPTFLG